jgi:UDP-glucose 4-epimerase
MSTILVTGGAGYIGSHTVIELLNAGHQVVVVDSLVNSSAEALVRVERITGRKLAFHHLDLLDRVGLEQVFHSATIDAVIHFAALKAVGESVAKPLIYYRNNLVGTITLLECMQEAGCRDLVFSSSATVYGDPERVPITEGMALRSTNPYGRTKLMIEDMCRDLALSDPRWRIVLLRYFNPIGAHPSGLIGEDPQGLPNNLMPFLMQVAVGKREFLTVHGADYPTPDGTGVRDYIHVEDLATAHLDALTYLRGGGASTTLNVGYGHGYSVREVIDSVQRVTGKKLTVKEEPRRAGDPAALVARAERIRSELGWKPRLDDLDTIVRTAYAWEQRLQRDPW